MTREQTYNLREPNTLDYGYEHPNYSAKHKHNKVEHTVNCYERNITDGAALYYAFCPECRLLIHKRVVGFDNDNRTAYVTWYIQDGVRVMD